MVHRTSSQRKAAQRAAQVKHGSKKGGHLFADSGVSTLVHAVMDQNIGAGFPHKQNVNFCLYEYPFVWFSVCLSHAYWLVRVPVSFLMFN